MLASFSVTRAQSNGTANGENRNTGESLSIGPAFSLGQGFLLGSLGAGWQTTSRFTWSAGAIASYSIVEGLSLDLGLAYDVRGVYIADSSPRVTFENKYRYLSIRPAVSFGGFFIGAGLGIPLGSTIIQGDQLATYAPVEGSTSDMNMLIEARIGLSIPLLQSDFGELHIMLAGSYGFTRIVNNLPDNTVNNGPLATISVGATYLIKVWD